VRELACPKIKKRIRGNFRSAKPANLGCVNYFSFLKHFPMKKFASLSLMAIVATLGITLSSYQDVPIDGGGSGPNEQQYSGTCPNGKVIQVCGVNGSGCTPSGSC
jgi:hypothetical protein